MTQKNVPLQPLPNLPRKKVKIKSQNIKTLLKIIWTDNITELNDLIYAEAKLISDKIRNLQEKSNRKFKTIVRNKVIWMDKESAKMNESMKKEKLPKDTMETKYWKKTRADKTDNSTQRNK